jgi:hypothetical protein
MLYFSQQIYWLQWQSTCDMQNNLNLMNNRVLQNKSSSLTTEIDER